MTNVTKNYSALKSMEQDKYDKVRWLEDKGYKVISILG